jgi:two-component system sensor kinase
MSIDQPMTLNSRQLKTLSLSLLRSGSQAGRSDRDSQSFPSREQSLLDHLLVEVEEDRAFISKWLFDLVLQDLAAIKLQLENLDPAPGNGPVRLVLTEALMESIQKQIDGIHDLVFELRPPILDELGLEPTLRWFKNRLSRQNPGRLIRARFRLGGRTWRPELDLAVFRIIQRACTQAIHCRRAEVLDLRVEGGAAGLSLGMTDNGLPLDVIDLSPEISWRCGLDLAWLIQWAEFSGGRLEYRTPMGEGVELRVLWPGPETEPEGGRPRPKASKE